METMCALMYCKYGNFVLRNFRMKNYHVNINSAHVFFVGLIFIAAIDYEIIIFYNEKFPHLRYICTCEHTLKCNVLHR